MTEHGHDPALAAAWRWRRGYLLATMIGWFLVDVLGGALIDGRAWEHGVEAGFWALVAAAYLPFARRRPLPGDGRVADGMMASGALLISAASLLRATLPNTVALRWAMLLLAGWLAVNAVRALRGRTRAAA